MRQGGVRSDLGGLPFSDAPKTGDKAAPRIKKGAAALPASAMKGVGAMPPQGGAASEAEIKATVEYMISLSK